jgi:hypothetical protein
MDMVRSGEVLLPGDSIDPDNLPPGPPGSPVQQVTQEGLRELNRCRRRSDVEQEAFENDER